MNIRYIPYQHIDKQKWDLCITEAPNGLIYARSFYLDTMTSGRWDALVLNDYEAVMPLTWNRKWGLYYLYQPYFMPSLGVFGKHIGENVAGTEVGEFLNAIPGKFRFWEIDLSETNHAGGGKSKRPLKISSRTNHFLSLDRTYEEIRKDYKRLAKRMVQKAKEDRLEVNRQASPQEIISLYQKGYQDLHKITQDQYDRLGVCATTAMKMGNASTYLAKGPDNEISAFYLVFSDDHFVYSVLGGSTSKGKESGAFYLLTDAVLEDHANSERIFRFEGSDIPGIAFFDAQFGSWTTRYNHLKMNSLPLSIRWLKE